MATLYNLQALRAAAAAMVVLHHTRDLGHALWPWLQPIHVGGAGVDIFFVLSGVVISLSGLHHQGHPGQFLLRRVARVVPMYWLALWLIGLLLLAGMQPLGIHPDDATPLNMLKSMFFIPFERHHGGIMPLLGVGWTLNFEMFFYLVFAVALLAPRALRPVTIAVIIGALVAFGLLADPRATVPVFFTNPIMLEFLAGVGLARLWRVWQPTRHDRIAGVALILVSIAWFAVCFRPEGFHELATLRIFYFGVPAVACVAGAMLLEASGARATSATWQLLGAASYVLYLFHSLLIQILERLTASLGFDLSVPSTLIVLMILCFLLSHVAGVLIHLWVEKPVTLLVRRLLGLVRPVLQPDTIKEDPQTDLPAERRG